MHLYGGQDIGRDEQEAERGDDEVEQASHTFGTFFGEIAGETEQTRQG